MNDDPACLYDTRHFIRDDILHPPPGTIQTTNDVIVAWRVWRVATSKNLLQSVFMNHLWLPGVPMTACCANMKAGMRHGIHAFERDDEDDAKERARMYMADQQRTPKPVQFVLGEVSLWGRVILHQKGYRAAFAYPRRLLVPDTSERSANVARELRRLYGVETEVISVIR
jgi:hypothetical protein